MGMKLSADQKRIIKSVALFTGMNIVFIPLMTLVAGRHWTWGDFFLFAGITILLYGLFGFFYVLGSKIPKKDK